MEAVDSDVEGQRAQSLGERQISPSDGGGAEEATNSHQEHTAKDISLSRTETSSRSIEQSMEDEGAQEVLKVAGQEEHEGSARTHQQTLRTPTGRMPRQWLIDRCDGTSKYNPESRPPCRMCYVPIPVKWFPDYLEQNCCCECFGRIGCIHPENTRVRRNLFRAAFIINLIGLGCLIISMLAITDSHYNFLWRTEFTKVWLQLVEGPTEFTDVPVYWAVGLRAIAYDNELTDVHGIADFNEVCAIVEDRQAERESEQQQQQNVGDTTILLMATEPEFDCNNCDQISGRIVPSLFLSMLSYIPNFTTDILRMYSNYDVNCQKFLASTFSWISLATAIYTWVNYRKGCFESLNTEPFAINESFERVELGSDDVYLIVNYKWQAGLGQICLGIATFLKIIDIVFNLILPTPTVTRDFLEQVEYEWKYGHDDNDCGNDDEKQELVQGDCGSDDDDDECIQGNSAGDEVR